MYAAKHATKAIMALSRLCQFDKLRRLLDDPCYAPGTNKKSSSREVSAMGCTKGVEICVYIYVCRPPIAPYLNVSGAGIYSGDIKVTLIHSEPAQCHARPEVPTDEQKSVSWCAVAGSRTVKLQEELDAATCSQSRTCIQLGLNHWPEPSKCTDAELLPLQLVKLTAEEGEA